MWVPSSLALVGKTCDHLNGSIRMKGSRIVVNSPEVLRQTMYFRRT